MPRTFSILGNSHHAASLIFLNLLTQFLRQLLRHQLPLHELFVSALVGHELLVSALFDDFSPLEYDNLVRVPDRR